MLADKINTSFLMPSLSDISMSNSYFGQLKSQMFGDMAIVIFFPPLPINLDFASPVLITACSMFVDCEPTGSKEAQSKSEYIAVLKDWFGR